MNDVNADFPRTFLAFDVPNYLAALEAYDGTARPEGGTYQYADAAPEWNPLQSYRVSEKTTSLYVQADLGGERWSADVGVRFGKTQTTAQAWDAEILSITENGPFNYTAEYADPTPIDAGWRLQLRAALGQLHLALHRRAAAAARRRQDHGAAAGRQARAHQHHRKHFLG